MKLQKVTTAFIIMVLTVLPGFGCVNEAFGNDYENPGDLIGNVSNAERVPVSADLTELVEYENNMSFVETEFERSAWDTLDSNGKPLYTDIFLSDYSSRIEYEKNSGVVIDNTANEIKIIEGGIYRLSGTLTNGRVVVIKKADVRLILDGVSIESRKSNPISFLKGGIKVITVARGSENYLYDAEKYVNFYDNEGNFVSQEENKINGALYSQYPLTINGNGTLTVVGNYNNGISCKSALKIKSGNINVVAPNNAIKAKTVDIKGGNIVVQTNAGDGIKANAKLISTEEGEVIADDETGYVNITGGSVKVTSMFDGIQAETMVSISGETTKVDICSGCGADSNRYGDDLSRKGIKSGRFVSLDAFSISLDSNDDAVCSEYETAISGGSVYIRSSNSAIQSPVLSISGGRTEINKSSKGVKTTNFTLSGGTLNVNSEDDGIHCENFSGYPVEYDCAFILNGSGIADVNSLGDCIDSKGTVLVEGGTLWCDGMYREGKAAIKALGGFIVNGGKIMAIGGLGMIQFPAVQSEQNSISFAVRSGIPSGMKIVLVSEDGSKLFSRVALNKSGSVFFSSPAIEEGKSYSVYLGNNCAKKLVAQALLTKVGIFKVA